MCSFRRSIAKRKYEAIKTTWQLNIQTKKKQTCAIVERKLISFSKEQSTFTSSTTTNEKILLANYNKLHTTADDLILIAAVEMVFGDKETARLKTMPLSNSAIKRRINDMVEDIRAQVIETIEHASQYRWINL